MFPRLLQEKKMKQKTSILDTYARAEFIFKKKMPSTKNPAIIDTTDA